jgi:hypothetical protein
MRAFVAWIRAWSLPKRAFGVSFDTLDFLGKVEWLSSFAASHFRILSR